MLAIKQKIVIVTRPTRLEGLVARHATASQAKFQMVRAKLAAPRPQAEEELGALELAELDKEIELAGLAEFDAIAGENEAYQSLLRGLRRELGQLAPVQVIDREFLPNYLFGQEDVVVTLGQDGLVANTAKYALERPIVAINPDPDHIDGILLPFRMENAIPAVRRALRRQARTRAVTLAEAVLADGQRLLAFNDLFIGARTHVSARYRIEFAGATERHSSSGVIVSTGAGSTGWLSSLFNMAGTVRRLSGAGEAAPRPLTLGWEDPRLVFITREPFVSKTSSAALTSGLLQPGQELIIESAMSREGVIFSDGIEADFLEFNAGTVARIRASEKRAELVMP